jgi:PASTA domain
MRKRGLLIAAISAFVITISSATPAIGSAHGTPQCVVPALKGLSLTKARARLAKADCKVGAVKGIRAGNVASQRPTAGKHVRRWAKVDLTMKLPKLRKGSVTYKTKVDPSFTQNPQNPLQVTYAYSGDATESVNGVTVDLAAAGELPPGVLNFYASYDQAAGSPEQLICSINVGGTVSGGSCTVTYSATGTYQVTTQYLPTGYTPVTETDEENIQPFATTTTLSCSSNEYDTVVMPTCVPTSFDPHGNRLPSTTPGTEGLKITDTTSGVSMCVSGTLGSGAVQPGTAATGITIALKQVTVGGNPVYELVFVSNPASYDWALQPIGWTECAEADSGPPIEPQPADSFTVQAVWQSPGGGFADSASTTEPITIPVAP